MAHIPVFLTRLQKLVLIVEIFAIGVVKYYNTAVKHLHSLYTMPKLATALIGKYYGSPYSHGGAGRIIL